MEQVKTASAECPAMAAIREIHGSGIYTDDDSRVVKIGGAEIVVDDVSYYMMIRKIELARFELARPTEGQCAAKYASMFHSSIGLDFTAMYSHILDKSLNKRHIRAHFIQLVDMISAMEEVISAKIAKMGMADEPINVSLPNVFLLPHIDKLLAYRPDVLADTMNQLVDYMNKLNVNAIISAPITSRLDPVAPFTATPPTIVMGPRTPTETHLAAMKRLLAQEELVALYVREVETYHVAVMNSGAIYDRCKKIIDTII